MEKARLTRLLDLDALGGVFNMGVCRVAQGMTQLSTPAKLPGRQKWPTGFGTVVTFCDLHNRKSEIKGWLIDEQFTRRGNDDEHRDR
jgi:hypothetical protein